MYLIAGIVVAVLFTLLGLRMIIRALPDVLSENLLRDVESACQMGAVITVLGGPKAKLSTLRRAGIGLILLLNTGVISKLIGREHRQEVASLGKKFLEKLPEPSPEVTNPSSVLITSTRETVRSIIHQAESNEGDHLHLLRQIKEIVARLPESLNSAKLLDELHDQISQSISQLLMSDQVQVVETAGILAETLHGLEQELGQCSDLNPVVLTDKIFKFRELLELCYEMVNEPSGRVSPRDDNHKDHYEILGVVLDASLSDIKSAYRERAAQFHPDRKEEQLSKVDDPEVKEEIERAFNDKMVQVNLAYEILSDPDKRTLYDAEYIRRKR